VRSKGISEVQYKNKSFYSEKPYTYNKEFHSSKDNKAFKTFDGGMKNFFPRKP